jgi:hypothetical protein
MTNDEGPRTKDEEVISGSATPAIDALRAALSVVGLSFLLDLLSLIKKRVCVI